MLASEGHRRPTPWSPGSQERRQNLQLRRDSERPPVTLTSAARRMARALAVLFFDEVAAIGDSRQPIRGNAGKTLVNQLLSEMDGVDSAIDRVLVLSFGSLRGQVA